MIELPSLDRLQTQLWSTMLDMSEHTDGWTLVGGQMVFLHAVEHGRTPPRISRDIDVIVDVRVRPPALPRLIATLGIFGFKPDERIADETARRFVSGDVTVDVLAPDGTGSRADLRTVGSAQTVPISGGSYALRHSHRVDIALEGRIGVVPRPELEAALVIKARAARLDRKIGPARHLTDLAFLCSLVPDPLEMNSRLASKTRRYLTAVTPLLDENHGAWLALGSNAGDAKAAFDLIRRG